MPKPLREQPNCIALYSKQLIAYGYHEEAEKLLRKNLTRHGHAALVEQYGNARIQNADLQLERAEAWFETPSLAPLLRFVLTQAELEQLAARAEFAQLLSAAMP